MAGSQTDGRKAALTAATIVAVGMIAQQVAAKAARDAFFLSEFPATALPTVMIAGAAVSLIVVLVMSRAMTRWGPARVVPVVFGAESDARRTRWNVLFGGWLAGYENVYVPARRREVVERGWFTMLFGLFSHNWGPAGSHTSLLWFIHFG